MYASWSSSAWGTFYGGDGNDLIEGGNTVSTNHEFGGAGDDYVFENQGGLTMQSHYIDGGPGRDALYGSNGSDTIFGGDGNESGASINAVGFGAAPGLYGYAGNDILDAAAAIT